MSFENGKRKWSGEFVCSMPVVIWSVAVCISVVNVVSCHVLYFVFQCTSCKIYCVVDGTVCVCKVALLRKTLAASVNWMHCSCYLKNTRAFDRSVVVSHSALFIIQLFPNIFSHSSAEFHFSMPSHCILIGICFAIDVLKPSVKSRWFQYGPVLC